MKKIFTLAMSAAFGVFAMSAATPEVAQISTAAAEEMTAEAVAGKVVAPVNHAPAQVNDVLGTYTWYFKSGLAGKSGNGATGQVIVTADEKVTNGVNVKLQLAEKNYFTIPGTLNPATGEITLPSKNLGKDSDGLDMVFAEFDWTGSSPVALTTPLVLTYDGKRLLPKPGMVWGVGAYNNGTLEGYYMLTYQNFIWGDFTWETVATVPFTNNFFPPMFGKANLSVNATVYKAKESPSILRVDNFNGAVTTQALPCYIDVTNAARVYIPVQSSGIEATDRGMTWYASVTCVTSDVTGPITNPTNTSLSAIPTMTVKDGKTTINLPATSCRFNWTAYAGNDGKWYYNGSTKDTTLEIPADLSAGISDVVADENAPVEYFNLQGVKINEPAAGQIVIRRQGSKVTKVIR